MNRSCFFTSAFGNACLGLLREKPNSWRRYWHRLTVKTTSNLFLTCSETAFPSQLLKSYPNLRGWVEISLFSSSFWASDKREGLPGGFLSLIPSKPSSLKALTQNCKVALDLLTMLATVVQLPISCINTKAWYRSFMRESRSFL